VRYGKGLDEEGSQGGGTARDVEPDVHATSHAIESRAAMGENRGSQRASERKRMRCVITMIVSHEEAQRRARRHEVRPQRAHSLGSPRRIESRVDEQALPFRLDDEAVPARSAAKDEDAHRTAIVAHHPRPCRRKTRFRMQRTRATERRCI
jgi:hypothetical protein